MIRALGRFLIRLGRRLAPDATYSGSTVEREVSEIRAGAEIDDIDILRQLHAREEALKAERAATAGPPPGQVADATPAVITAEEDGTLMVRGRAGVLEFGSARPIDPVPSATDRSFRELNQERIEAGHGFLPSGEGIPGVEDMDDMIRVARARTTTGTGFVADSAEKNPEE